MWGLLDGSKRDYVFFEILKNEASATEAQPPLQV
jgi:hypothetical protein